MNILFCFFDRPASVLYSLFIFIYSSQQPDLMRCRYCYSCFRGRGEGTYVGSHSWLRQSWESVPGSLWACMLTCYTACRRKILWGKCYSRFRDTKLKLRDVKQRIQGYTNTVTTKFQILHLSDFKRGRLLL